MNIITITLDDGGRITDADFVAWIMNEITEKVYTRRDVAKTYAILIQKGHKDFAEINRAILKRWSPSGLEWIKKEAWKVVEAT